MRRFAFVLTTLLLVAACGSDAGSTADHQSEWLRVLDRKKAAVAPDASPRHKQAYADSLAAFVRKHPQHSRARKVYQRIQLEFADELAQHGRYRDAVRFYRAVLAHDGRNEHALAGLREASDRLAVTRQKLQALDKGMSRKDVAAILGKPMPGWTATRKRSGATMEAWYYRTTSGSVAGVYFRDGRLLAAEEQSDARVARW